MASRGKDTFGLILVGIGVIALVLLFILNLPFFAWLILALIVAAIFIIAALVIVGVLAIVPMYFLKHGPDSEQSANYKIEDVKPIKEDEKK
ncbi:MAG: hypothetical protein A4E32_01812 [Methanomassiliicoccales archaeon PtaU1.Bin124]|nr:MAG: hypothetical protein A4E32_01812 [Methanomassiliicoccales archaeon PtaU1.Bin124]